MSTEVHQHEHRETNTYGPGAIIFGDTTFSFSDCQFYLETTDLKNEQRVCVNLREKVPATKLKIISDPFGTLKLENPIFVGGLPLQKLMIYLLSSTITVNRVDLLITPPNKLISKLLPPAFKF